MEFTLYKEAAFRRRELLLDSDNAKITSGKTIRLYIYEVVDGGTWKVYDWDDDTFKTGAPTSAHDP